MYIYIAGPLFSAGERAFNFQVKTEITTLGYQSFLPQQDGYLVEKMLAEGQQHSSVFKKVYELDIKKLGEVDAVLAILDGAVIDEGTAFEIGYATALGKPCFGLQTDSRRQLPTGNNPMIERSLMRVFNSVDDINAGFSEALSVYFPRRSPAFD
jgi:nucleoside 2-deoxyribosyltransferase